MTSPTTDVRPGAPKFFTRRNPSRPSLGRVVCKVIETVRGYKLMPWQRYVIHVAWELDPEHPGELWYTEGDISVPRQAGKSDMVEGQHIAGAMLFADWASYMTAQSGKDAGKRWRALVEHLHLGEANRGQDWKIMRGRGSEIASYLPQSSLISPFAPTEDALHGDHNNFITIDEEWAFTLEEGSLLEIAAKPGFLVPKLVQMQRVSTMGTANSTYMAHNVELGRIATLDPGARRFYFEWSADENLAEADPYSDATLSFHPAIGYTQSARRIRDLGRDMPLGQWRRSFLNLPTDTSETCIDLALWDTRRWNYDPNEAPVHRYKPARPEDMVVAWDVAADGSAASIVTAWLTPEGIPAVELAATAPGTDWLAPTLEKLHAEGYRRIITDSTGTNATILQDLQGRSYDGEILTYGAYVTACQTLLDRIRTGDIEHDGANAVIDAIQKAELKPTRTGHIFDAASSAGPIDALRAVAIAQDAAARHLKAPIIQLF